MKKAKVLLLCTGNACRSQMAEGLVRERIGSYVDVYSAGVHPVGVHPYASKVLEELGIDPSNQYSKHVKELEEIHFDLVVTLCDHASRTCPVFKNANDTVHMPFVDPIYAIGTEDEVVAAFRTTRNDIEKRLIPFLREYFKIDERT